MGTSFDNLEKFFLEMHPQISEKAILKVLKPTILEGNLEEMMTLMIVDLLLILESNLLGLS